MQWREGNTLDVPCHEQWVLLHLGPLPIERIMPPSTSRPLGKPSVHVALCSREASGRNVERCNTEPQLPVTASQRWRFNA
ncbi:hypothetical protein R3I93_003084 [Phoxinus phoxinus]|uniref:Uncharacterized protein n=1 Tax=Phoxinus phoxinus TaxID=58324 RepID=A0AAN9DF57_9TELE